MQTTGPAGPAWSAHPSSTRLWGSIDLRVSKRLLWVGDAAYPLQNIARVYTFKLRPRRQEAVALFLKRVAITAFVVGSLTMFSVLLDALASLGRFGSDGSDGSGGFVGFIGLVWISGLAAVVYSMVELMPVLTATAHYVLAVETSGPSTAVVTSKNPDQLRQLVHYIAYAIENPDTEFQVKVESITISPKCYYFGDNVNMYGGRGNVGMVSA